MAIRVSFEIGHEASVRTKRTPEGFTHDWEVFVRGVDGANISHFVDKVVFLLHESFLKPKRVVKEPPYTVKESGYAGFNLPIDIYLKNRDEPKRIRFYYDLILHESGPPIVKVQKEKYIFQNPTDEFKKKLLKGGGIVSTSYPFLQHLHNLEQERDSRDSYTDEKPTHVLGKTKPTSENIKKHKSKDYRSDDLPRPTNSFENLFGPPIHKSSKISPDPKKASPNPKLDKKDKEKLQIEKEKQKARTEINKDKDYKEDKVKSGKDEKERIKEDKRSKGYKDLDRSKEKVSKRPERPVSPSSETSIKRSPKRTQSPKRSVSPLTKSNGSVSNKEDKPRKTDVSEIKKIKPVDPDDVNKSEKKQKKDRKNYDRDKNKDSKREHRKEIESKSSNNSVNDVKETKAKEVVKVKESTPKDFPVHKDKERTPVKPEKVFNKFSIENMLKDPQEVSSKHSDSSKHKHRSPGEKKHKHKKKDKKHDESKEKHKEEKHREKKHKHDKYKEKLIDVKETVNIEKSETIPIEKNVFAKVTKEKERSMADISPVSTESNSQTNFKSAVKSTPKQNKNPLGSMIEALSSSSNNSEAEMSISDDEASNTVSKSTPKAVEVAKPEIPKNLYDNKTEKQVEKVEKNNVSVHKEKNSKKPKDKDTSVESKDEKRQKKRKGTKRDSPDIPPKQTKLSDEVDLTKSSKGDISNGSQTSDSSLRIKSDAKSQDSSMSSGAGDENTSKCESPDSEDTSQGTADLREMTPDYMMQLKDLQHKIMTIQSNDELERVVNLIAETGKYEVTKKTFDFDLCLLDRSTVQQLQELIGCESRA